VNNRAPLAVAIVLLLLPVLYVGSYLALVTPDKILFVETKNGTYFTSYRVRGVGQFFYPLKQIDRKLRPRVWEGDIELIGLPDVSPSTSRRDTVEP
jgi:hypothetical protein